MNIERFSSLALLLVSISSLDFSFFGVCIGPSSFGLVIVDRGDAYGIGLARILYGH
jgi:hypothetical protein